MEASMFLNSAHVNGKSGIGRLMFTSLMILILFILSGIAVAQDGDILRVGMPAPENLDPATGSNDPEILFNGAIYDYLIDVRPDNSLAPNLASAWEISEDGLTYTFTLVEGVMFHDGADFTSADVVFTFNRLKEVESAAVGLLGDFGVAADGDYAVVFTLAGPNADFLYGVASRFAFILKDGTESPGVLGEGDNVFANFNGTGPFVLVEYSAGERAFLAANENYWIEGQPMVDGVEFLFISDALTQVDALRSGALDFIFKIDVSQLSTLESDDGVNIIQVVSNQHPLIRIRSDEGHLGEDVRIRQAFRLTTNREELLETVQEGLGLVGNNDQIGPTYGPFFADIDNPAFDPEAACDLIMDATGAERLGPLDFYVDNALNFESLAVALQQQWSLGCIDVNILMRESGIYYSNNEWMEVDLGITGWGHRPVPQMYLNVAVAGDGQWNEAHFADAEVDELIAQASVTADTAERADIYAQISTILAERGPYVIPWFASLVGATGENVQGLEMHPFPGLTDLRTVSLGN
jgi:peptide/nickel transport system substrate-binding protein